MSTRSRPASPLSAAAVPTDEVQLLSREDGAPALYFNVKSNNASDRASALRSEHAGANCAAAGPPSFCGDITSANKDQDGAASASRVFWIGSGVLLAGTVVSGVLWATSGSSSKTGALLPAVGPGSAGATYRFAF